MFELGWREREFDGVVGKLNSPTTRRFCLLAAFDEQEWRKTGWVRVANLDDQNSTKKAARDLSESRAAVLDTAIYNRRQRFAARRVCVVALF